MPPPPAESGTEKRVTSVLVAALVVNSTYSPVLLRVTALRPDASPARSPTVRLGPTVAAPPPVAPSSASYMSKGMLAPRPTNKDWVALLFSRLTGSSLASAATVVRTVYEPLAAVQVPTVTAPVVAPAAIVPSYEPVRVRTVAPLESTSATVMPCAPPAEPMVPWLRRATLKVTVSPSAGPDGEVVSTGTRSELLTGRTTSELGLV